MKILKITALIVLALICAAAGFYIYFKNSRTPQYSGELTLKGLNGNVDVYFTEYGIPHIYADSNEDAWYAFGYVHAQDRLWQMDLLRHVGRGRLSELFGEDLIDADRFLRTVGLAEYAEQSAESYIARNHESLPIVKAYLNGINDFISNNPKPLEHTILGVEIEPFTEKDVFAVLTYMAFSFQNAHLTDPFLTELSSKVDSSYLADLRVYHYKGETTIPNHDSRLSELSRETAQVLSDLNVPIFTGSNSWVLGREKTTTGEVILANDPHIGFAQPSIWYEAHLITPDIEYYGYHIAGSPFPPILHTPEYSNGLTMFENDDVDFYIEEIHPEDSNMYQHKGEWKEMGVTSEKIKVKGEEDVDLTIRSTVHGPVVSDVLQEEPLEDIVSMYWVTTHFENFTLESTYGFVTAENMDDVEECARLIHGPGLNIMYGDKDGNVAWWASGKLIRRLDERTSKTFYDGASGLFDADSMYSFDQNPHSVNPPWNYTFSANNQPDTVNGIVYSGYYLPDDRGDRIKGLIDGKDQFSIDDVKAMMLDSRSRMFEEVKGILLFSIKDYEDPLLLRALIDWDASFQNEDFRPVIFQKWMYEILAHAMMDEMGEDLWESYKGTHTYKVAIEHLIKNADSKWWDDVNTEETETRDEIIRHSFEDAMYGLRDFWGDDYTKWKWGNAHTLTHNHAMGTAISMLNVGPFKPGGGNEVINNLGYTYTGEKYQPITYGPSTRRIVDFSDVRNNSWSILPTGQSGNYFSPYYADQAEMYAKGEFRKMMMNENEIKSSSSVLKIRPE